MEMVIAIASVSSAVFMAILVFMTGLHHKWERTTAKTDDTILFSALRKMNGEFILTLENIGKYPAVQLDISLTVPKSYPHSDRFSDPIDSTHIPDTLFPGPEKGLLIVVPIDTNEKGLMEEGIYPELHLLVKYETPSGVERFHRAEFSTEPGEQQAIRVPEDTLRNILKGER